MMTIDRKRSLGAEAWKTCHVVSVRIVRTILVICMIMSFTTYAGLGPRRGGCRRDISSGPLDELPKTASACSAATVFRSRTGPRGVTDLRTSIPRLIAPPETWRPVEDSRGSKPPRLR
jgi:hypothetical protein